VLDTLSYQRVLSRGFALVTRPDGALVRSAKALSEGDALRLRFADGEIGASAGKGSSGPPATPAPSSSESQRPRIRRPKRDGGQGDLF
jgi:exodeoxyribonuclease VII large subunit